MVRSWSNYNTLSQRWSDVKAWSSPDFKITKEEWKQKYPNHEIALRLDDHVDFDVDNPLVKRFIKNYLKSSPNIFGRDSNPESHYVWKGKLTFKQFILPAELNEYCKIFPHGSTLCEIRTDAKHYTIVPGSMHSKAPEIVKWEKYSSLTEYPGNLNNDLRKIALSSALCILYASQGSRDAYCTAIAGALLKQTEWNEEEINEFCAIAPLWLKRVLIKIIMVIPENFKIWFTKTSRNYRLFYKSYFRNI